MYAAVFRFRFSLDFLEIIHIDTCVYAFSNTAMRYSAILLWCYIYLNKLCAITSTSSTKKNCKKIREIKAFWDIIIDSKEKHKEKSFNLWENHSSEKKKNYGHCGIVQNLPYFWNSKTNIIFSHHKPFISEEWNIIFWKPL